MPDTDYSHQTVTAGDITWGPERQPSRAYHGHSIICLGRGRGKYHARCECGQTVSGGALPQLAAVHEAHQRQETSHA